MDPLSEVMSLLKPSSYTCAGYDVGGNHSVLIPEHEGLICYALLSGEMWFAVEGVPEPMLLRSSDCIVLPTGRPVQMATDLTLPPIDAELALELGEEIGGVRIYEGGGKCFLIACHFLIDGNQAQLLLNMLPPVVHIATDDEKAALRWVLDRMSQELHDPQPGSAMALEHLAHLVMLQVLRLHLAEGGVGWLFALGDKELSTAIAAIHENPAHRWTVDSLAERAGMSRTSFAVRFKEAVGVSPVDYLRRWRMLLAGDRLTTTNESVCAIALSLGYESESAFSTAFKRVMGVSPRQYARRELMAVQAAA